MVRAPQHGIARDYRLEGADGLSAFWCPYEGYILFCEALNWSNYVCVSFDERAVVPKQTQRAPNVVYVVQYLLPRGQAIAFGGVDADDSSFDPDAQVIYGSLVE